MWISVPAAVLFSVAAVFSYLGYMGQRMAVGGWIGLAGREQDIVIAQHRATDWLTALLLFQMGSAIMATFALPFDFTESRWLRVLIRFSLAAAISVLLSLVIGIIAISIAAGLRQVLRH